jgi:hypothetical protein
MNAKAQVRVVRVRGTSRGVFGVFCAYQQTKFGERNTMTAYADGTLIKASSPDIDMVKHFQGKEERRCIPDPPTFNNMGLKSANIKQIADAEWEAIPAGPAFPSRADGTLLKGSNPAIYVMLSGQRRLIPDADTFNARGYKRAAIHQVEDEDLNAIPAGATLPSVEAHQPRFPITASQENSFPGSGGHMHTTINLVSSGDLNAVTRTWEDTKLRGFRGAVAVAVTDQNLKTLWVSATQLYGVDGTMMGTHDRTENWSAKVPAPILPQIRKIAIIQQWNPKDVFNDIQAWLGGLAAVANQIEPIVQDVATIAAVV